MSRTTIQQKKLVVALWLGQELTVLMVLGESGLMLLLPSLLLVLWQWLREGLWQGLFLLLWLEFLLITGGLFLGERVMSLTAAIQLLVIGVVALLLPISYINLQSSMGVSLLRNRLSLKQSHSTSPSDRLYSRFPEEQRNDVTTKLRRLRKGNKPEWFIKLKEIQFFLELIWANICIRWDDLWHPRNQNIDK